MLESLGKSSHLVNLQAIKTFDNRPFSFFYQNAA